MFEYTPEIGNKICNAMVAGKSIDRICKGIKGLEASDIFGWIHKGERRLHEEADLYSEFVTKYRFAREVQAEQALDHILDVEKMLTNDDIGAPTANALIKSLQWRAQICRPERYLPKERREHSLDGKVDPWAAMIAAVSKTNSGELENAKTKSE